MVKIIVFRSMLLQSQSEALPWVFSVFSCLSPLRLRVNRKDRHMNKTGVRLLQNTVSIFNVAYFKIDYVLLINKGDPCLLPNVEQGDHYDTG